MHAIILAGGFGTRLRSVVSDVPKPLAPIEGKPFLAWLSEALIAQGVTSITFSVHHQWEKIKDYFDHYPLPVPVELAVEQVPLGTGGAIAYALERIKSCSPVLVLNGDTYVTVDYQALYQHHSKHNATMTMVLRHVSDTGRYGQIMVDQNVVTRFEPGQAGQDGLINAGVYVLSPDIFTPYVMPQTFSFEQDFMQVYVDTVKPQAFMAGDYFIDIGIPDDYAKACTELPQVIVKKAHAVNA